MPWPLVVHYIRLQLTYPSCIQFADDTTLYTGGKSVRLIECEINHDLEIISDWFRANKLTLNVDKTVCMVFPPKKSKEINIDVKLFDQSLPVQTSTKFLGVWLDSHLDWSTIFTRLKQNRTFNPYHAMCNYSAFSLFTHNCCYI